MANELGNGKLVKMATDINEKVRTLQMDGEPDSGRFSGFPEGTLRSRALSGWQMGYSQCEP